MDLSFWTSLIVSGCLLLPVLTQDLEALRANIPGEPGTDYPVFPFVPATGFSCAGQIPGFYADPEAGCQVFHVCNDDRQMSMLCPNGTVFNQQYFVCDWWFNFDCNSATQFYDLNSFLFQEPVAGRSSNLLEPKNTKEGSGSILLRAPLSKSTSEELPLPLPKSLVESLAHPIHQPRAPLPHNSLESKKERY